MKICLPLLLGCLLHHSLVAREIDLRIWVSGGMQGLVMGNRDCPGWLAVAKKITDEDAEACWIQLGAPPLQEPISGLKIPDAVSPIEADFRLQALSGGEGLLNVGALPQFPEYQPPFAPVQVWRQEDGVEVHVFALISEHAPLRVPRERLRPLRVLPALASFRAYLAEHPLAENVFPVLILPEGENPTDWATLLPELSLFVQPAGGMFKVIEVQGGKGLRVQPARYGKAMIRVQIYWDTVRREFRAPTAEGVWVNPPDLQGIDLPEPLLPRLRPVDESPDVSVNDLFLSHADAVLLPEQAKLKIDSRLPDAMRVSAFPQDQAWMRVQVPRKVWRQWQDLPGFEVLQAEGRLADPVSVLITAETAAGAGDWHSRIRQDLIQNDFPTEWMPFNSRDLIWPLSETP